MEKITISNSVYQGKIDAFERALVLLKDVKNIIREQSPNVKECADNPGYFDAWSDADSNCTVAICDISRAISELIQDDIANVYL